MRTPYLYGIVRNLEEVCELTNSKAYQIDWAISHVATGNSFLSFAAPYFEHVFEVVKFEEEEDDMEDDEFTKLFKKVDGIWTAIQTYQCEFCDSRSCDRALYKNELEDELSATRMLDKKMNEMRFRMYKRFIWHKHGLVGKKVRYEIDPCVMELIQTNFPLEVGKRKRGFEPAV